MSGTRPIDTMILHTKDLEEESDKIRKKAQATFEANLRSFSCNKRGIITCRFTLAISRKSKSIRGFCNQISEVATITNKCFVSSE